jgi:hypothetical protein
VRSLDAVRVLQMIGGVGPWSLSNVYLSNVLSGRFVWYQLPACTIENVTIEQVRVHDRRA